MQLFLIRHAQSDYSQNKYCGFSNPSLSKKGILQAVNLAAQIKQNDFDIVCASSLKRSIQTAKIIFPHKKIIITANLKELNFGLWEGLTYQQIVHKYNRLYTQWISEPFIFSPPSGENLLQLKKRVIFFLQQILSKYPHKKIVFVTHSGPIKIILHYVLRKKLEDFWQINIDLASISYLKFKDKRVIYSFLNKR